MTDAPFRLTLNPQRQPYYTPPASQGPVCMHSGELVRSPTYGTVAVRPAVTPNQKPQIVSGVINPPA